MNVFSEGFPKEIIDQINIRQNKHYLGYNADSLRDVDSHLYKNANSAWCRLVSSTDITNVNNIINTNLKYLPSDWIKNNELAKRFILFNGTTNNSLFSRRGVGFGGIDNAYTSWGKLNPSVDFGFKPMAGITSAKIRNLNGGSIRSAKVNVKVWDKMSFEIIDVLYLRPGFSTLLEWGHSMYYDNNGNLVTDEDNNDLMHVFLNGDISYSDLLNEIKNKRLETHGNYDAMFGRLNNFHWSLQHDGSYDITLDIISVGVAVESFKIQGNAVMDNNVSTTNPVTEPSATPPIEILLNSYYKSNSIVKYLLDRFYSLLAVGYSPSGVNTTWQFLDKPRPYAYVNSNKDAEVVAMYPYYDTDDVKCYYFVRLGDLLKFIQDEVLYKVKNKGNEAKFLYIDTDTKTNLMHAPDQLMSYDPRVCMVRRKIYYPAPINEYAPAGKVDQSSYNGGGMEYDDKTGYMKVQSDETMINNIVIDPSIINNTNTNTNTNANTNSNVSVLEGITESDEIFANPYADADYTDTNIINKFMSSLDEVGEIMNIYINYEFIISKLQELTDVNTNSVSLYSFLKELVSNINGAFGGYSKLDLWIDESTNTLKIIDQNPLPSNLSALRYTSGNIETATFDVLGYQSSKKEAGFIRNFKFTTEFSPDYSNMLAVSAANQGTAVGENNTALSKLNTGLIDKYKKVINGGGTPLKNTNDNQSIIDNYKIAKQEYEEFLSQLERYLSDLKYNIYNNDEIDSNKSKYTVFLKLYKKYEQTKSNYLKLTGESDPSLKSISANNKFQPGTGFMPFNLSLTMDGLSGIDIKNRFLIDSSYLPSNYPEVLDFLIKAVNHEISDNQWITTIESYCIAKGNDDNKSKIIGGSKKLSKPKEKPKVETKPKNKVETKNEPVASDSDLEKKLKKFNFHKIPDQTGSGNNNYRSAQLTEDLIPYVIKKYNIKNFVRYNGDNGDASHNGAPPTNRNVEKKLCEDNSCTYNKFSAGDVQDQQKINNLLNGGNTLIHCAHGADRTGGGVGAWLLSKNNSLQEVWNYTVQFNSWDNAAKIRNDKNLTPQQNYQKAVTRFNNFLSGSVLKIIKNLWGVKNSEQVVELQKNVAPPPSKLQ